jgi:hypothetical protein
MITCSPPKVQVFQPYTTDVTIEGLKRARNSMRLKLWADPSWAHLWLCHPFQGGPFGP